MDSLPGEDRKVFPKNIVLASQDAGVRETVRRLASEHRWGEAEVVLRQFLQVHPDNIEYQFRLADVLRFNQKFDEAVEHYTWLIEKFPENMDLRVGRGHSFMALGNFEKARADFDFILRQNPQHPDALQGMATLEKAVTYEDRQKAEQERRQRLQELLNEGRAFEDQKNFASAMRIYQNILREFPKEYEARFRLARVLVFQGKSDQSLEYFNELIQDHPANGDVWTGRGYAHMARQEWEQAKSDFRHALELNPQNADAAQGLQRAERNQNYLRAMEETRSLEAQGQHEEAEAILRKALRIDPDNGDLLFLLARNQTYQGNSEQALDIYNRLLEREPDNIDYLLGRAQVYKNSRLFDPAWRDFSEILKSHPDNRDALLGLGYVTWQRREYFESKALLEQLLEKDPDNESAKEWLINAEPFTRDRVTVETVIETFSNRTARKNYHAELYHPFGNHQRGLVGVDVVDNLGTVDSSGYVGFNTDVSKWTNIGLRQAFAPGAEFIPRLLSELELWQSLPGMPFEITFIYRFMSYKTVDFHMISPGFFIYLTDRATLLARVHIGFQNGTISESGYLKLNYRFTPEFYAYIGSVVGNQSFRILTSDVVGRVNTYSVQAGFSWRTTDWMTTRFHYEFETRERQFDRNVFGINFMFLF